MNEMEELVWGGDAKTFYLQGHEIVFLDTLEILAKLLPGRVNPHPRPPAASASPLSTATLTSRPPRLAKVGSFQMENRGKEGKKKGLILW